MIIGETHRLKTFEYKIEKEHKWNYVDSALEDAFNQVRKEFTGIQTSPITYHVGVDNMTIEMNFQITYKK